MERNSQNLRNDGYDIAMQLQNSIQSLFNELMSFLPEIIAAIVIIVLGFVLGGILGKAVRNYKVTGSGTGRAGVIHYKTSWI